MDSEAGTVVTEAKAPVVAEAMADRTLALVAAAPERPAVRAVMAAAAAEGTAAMAETGETAGLIRAEIGPVPAAAAGMVGIPASPKVVMVEMVAQARKETHPEAAVRRGTGGAT